MFKSAHSWSGVCKHTDTHKVSHPLGLFGFGFVSLELFCCNVVTRTKIVHMINCQLELTTYLDLELTTSTMQSSPFSKSLPLSASTIQLKSDSEQATGHIVLVLLLVNRSNSAVQTEKSWSADTPSHGLGGHICGIKVQKIHLIHTTLLYST